MNNALLRDLQNLVDTMHEVTPEQREMRWKLIDSLAPMVRAYILEQME